MYVNKLVLLVFALFINTVLSAYAPLENLEIGITKRVPIKKCTRTAKPGDTVSVHYSGYLRESMETFDSSHTRGQPIQFTLGVGQVIAGWDQGLVGMCIGEQRKVQIPSALGYGSREIPGAIPANSDLLFDVELVDIK